MQPTSGMDPSARRFAWSIIRAQRKHMSILITTHFLDEADALSDRVCILNEGRVAAFGSPVFLKDRFGEGYHLTVDWSGDTSDVAGIVKTHIPGALLTEDIRTELRFRLPKGSISLLSGLLERLESHRKVLSYGMSGPTLEDVFLDAGQKDSEDGAKDSESRRDELMKSLARKRREAREGDDCQRISAFALVWKQFQCLFVKRVRVFMRQWASLILQLVIPSFFLIIALALGELAGNSPVNSLGPRPITRNEFLQGMQGAFAQGSDCGSCAWISDHHPESLRLDALTEVGYLTPCACFCPTEYQVEEDDFFSIQRVTLHDGHFLHLCPRLKSDENMEEVACFVHSRGVVKCTATGLKHALMSRLGTKPLPSTRMALLTRPVPSAKRHSHGQLMPNC